jgi:dolichyl-phosphate-mannose-protein mannosyltransferase
MKNIKASFYFYICLTVIGLAVGWRISEIPCFDKIIFDEGSFIQDAELLNKFLPSVNDHPPLGKQLMLLGSKIFGKNIHNYRVSSLFAGILIILAFLGAYFRDRDFKWILMGLFSAIDQLFIVYSSTAHIDIYLILFLCLAIIFASQRDALIAGLIFGFSCAVKWSAFPSILPLLLLITKGNKMADNQNSIKLIITFFCGTLFTYLSIWLCYCLPTFGTLGSIKTEHFRLLNTQLNRQFVTPFSVSPWNWIFLDGGIYLWFETYKNFVKVILALPNPVLWWTCICSIVCCATKKIFEFRDKTIGILNEEIAICIIGFIINYVFWIFMPRESFIYHSLTAYLWGLLLLANLFKSNVVLGKLILIFTVLVFYQWFPIGVGKPIEASHFDRILVLPKFYPDIRRCRMQSCPSLN